MGLITAPLSSLRRTASLMGKDLKTNAGIRSAGMLRIALYAVSGLLGVLLSPIGIVVTARAGVALVYRFTDAR